MHILVLNGSPKGENSITLQTVRYLEKRFSDETFEVLHVGQRIKTLEKDFTKAAEALNSADLLLFCYPVYTFLVPSQLHRFIELVKEHGIDLAGKCAAQVSTSLHFYDITAHRFIRDNCDDLGLLYLGGLSADMEDLLKPQGRKDAEEFFRFLLWRKEHGYAERSRCGEPKPFTPVPLAESAAPAMLSSGRVAVVADFDPEEESPIRAMVSRFLRVAPFETTLVNLREFPFAGGCLGCFQCAAKGACVYKDGFDAYLREKIQTADAIVYAFAIKDHSMGYRMKLYDDRQFCNGHRTVTMGKPVGYLVSGPLSEEENLRTVIEARAEVGGNFLAGVACDEFDPDAGIEALSDTLRYAVDHAYQPPKTFWGVGGMKIFRDLIYQMRGLMKEDHRFYKKHGFYDFPQKRKGRILGMYLVGGMMRNKKLQKKLSGKMTEGMLLPYKKALEQAEKE
jgi:multimeric flavodoxin WrbA